MATGKRGMRLFAALTAAMTLVLILAGGLVTTTHTGDTIPTWPKSWGRMEVGWPVEWSHRAAAGCVAVLVTILAIWLQSREDRPGVRRIGWVAFSAVAVQALIGGFRIHTLAPVPVAIVHACFGQLVFCAMVATALVVSERWNRTDGNEATARARGIALATTAAAFLQLVAGAVTRHTGAVLAVHLVGAGLVLLLVSLLASRLLLTPLAKEAKLLLSVLWLQVALGIGTWAITAGGFVRTPEAPLYKILTVSAHVAVGALLLATSLAITLLSYRSSKVPRPALKAALA